MHIQGILLPRHTYIYFVKYFFSFSLGLNFGCSNIFFTYGNGILEEIKSNVRMKRVLSFVSAWPISKFLVHFKILLKSYDYIQFFHFWHSEKNLVGLNNSPLIRLLLSPSSKEQLPLKFECWLTNDCCNFWWGRISSFAQSN